NWSRSLGLQEAEGGARDVEFFVHRDDVDRDARSIGGDTRFFAASVTIASAIDFEAEPFEVRANPLSDELGMLSDTATENHRFRPAGDRQVCAEVLARTMDK